jgi:hypothetical protein
MNREIIHSQLRELLETLQEQYEGLRNTEGRISRLEFDIILETTRKFYDRLYLLHRLQDSPEAGQTATGPSTDVEEMIHREPPRKETASRKENPPVKPAPGTGEMDLFATPERPFDNKLREAREKSLPRKPATPDHLKSLIGINDKFLFLNDLFDGSLREYNEAIDTLNGFSVKQEALEFLDLLRKKNLWDPGSGSFLKMKEIVEKRFTL